LAAFEVLLEEKIIDHVKEKEQLFHLNLKHPKIKKISSLGLMLAVFFDSFETNKKIIDALIEKGIFTDWFLFSANALRIAPPLNISYKEINDACQGILKVLDEI
jgi:acetylornithine/succinyldiaminopimelate/putrescine aminotransferase